LIDLLSAHNSTNGRENFLYQKSSAMNNVHSDFHNIFIRSGLKVSSSIKKILSSFKKELKNSQAKFKETKRSALKGFATQYSIESSYKIFDSKTFLAAVEQKIIEKFKPQTKVRLILRTKIVCSCSN